MTTRRPLRPSGLRLRRAAIGSYVFDRPLAGVDVHYRIERGWADRPGTDRRPEWWVLTRVVPDRDEWTRTGDRRRPVAYVAEILSDHPTLSSARRELARVLEENR